MTLGVAQVKFWHFTTIVEQLFTNEIILSCYLYLYLQKNSEYFNNTYQCSLFCICSRDLETYNSETSHFWPIDA